MLIKMGLLTGFSVFGNTITGVLNSWAEMGVFAYALPFLLIFAIIFAIIMKTKMFGDNKGVAMVIALAAGLLSLQFDYVTSFFEVFFPWAGIGLVILLMGMILMGAAFDWEDEKTKWLKMVFFGIGGLIFLIVVLSSLSSYEWFGGWWWNQYWEAIIAGLVIVGLIVLAVVGVKKKEDGSK